MKNKNKYRIMIGSLIIITLVCILHLYICPYFEPAVHQNGFHVIHKTDDTIRIAFIGDSWAYLHKRHLCKIPNNIHNKNGKPVSIRSVGISGMTSKEVYYSIFYNDSVRSIIDWGPNFCIISAGINDTDLKMGKTYYKKNMQLILEFMKENNIVPIVLEIPHYDIRLSFNRRYKRQKILRLVSMLITCSEMNCIDSYRDAFEQLIKNNEVDCNLHYLKCNRWNSDGYQDTRCIYTVDNMHINEKGYQLLDSCLTEEILKSLNCRHK